MRATILAGTRAILFPRLRSTKPGNSPGELAALNEARLDLFKWDPLFVTPRPGDKNILDIFPELPMFFQIELNGHLAAFFIGNELDSVHSSIFLHYENAGAL